MKPLLAHVYEPHRVTFPCYVQPKLNGIRALYQAGHFQSRDGIPFPVGLLAHLAKPLLEIFDPSVVLDGELYVHGWPLQRINAAVTPVRQTPTEDTVKVEYHVFDVVDFGKPFEDRFRPAIFKWQNNMPWIIVDHWLANDTERADYYYAKFVSDGYEGLMYRLGDCPYTVPKQEMHFERHGHLSINTPIPKTKFLSDKNNRCWHLLKRKNWLDDEFAFVSINATIGDKGEAGFQMWLATHNRKSFKVSSGLTDKEVEQYLSSPPTGRKVKVKFLVYSSDGIPLNASIIAVL